MYLSTSNYSACRASTSFVQTQSKVRRLVETIRKIRKRGETQR